MDWELFGNLLLCLIIICIPALFAVANANYIPEEEKENKS